MYKVTYTRFITNGKIELNYIFICMLYAISCLRELIKISWIKHMRNVISCFQKFSNNAWYILHVLSRSRKTYLGIWIVTQSTFQTPTLYIGMSETLRKFIDTYWQMINVHFMINIQENALTHGARSVVIGVLLLVMVSILFWMWIF